MLEQNIVLNETHSRKGKGSSKKQSEGRWERRVGWLTIRDMPISPSL